jgi:ABC-type amino acid transport substrate-binding protein
MDDCFDVLFRGQCRAVAAAIFGSSEGRVEFKPLTAFERFTALAEGEVDMLARTTTHTMERSIMEVRSRVHAERAVAMVIL